MHDSLAESARHRWATIEKLRCGKYYVRPLASQTGDLRVREFPVIG